MSTNNFFSTFTCTAEHVLAAFWQKNERHLQHSLNMLSHWADTNGFKFLSSKTVCMHFCRLRNAHPNPEFKLNGTPIPVVEFFGVIFDDKLTFLPHIRYLKKAFEGAEPSALCCSHLLGS